MHWNYCFYKIPPYLRILFQTFGLRKYTVYLPGKILPRQSLDVSSQRNISTDQEIMMMESDDFQMKNSLVAFLKGIKPWKKALRFVI